MNDFFNIEQAREMVKDLVNYEFDLAPDYIPIYKSNPSSK